jgi:hypothetical protein
MAPVTMRVTVENLSMIRMIHAKRADYMFISPEEAEVAIRLSSVPPRELKLITHPDMPHGEKRYLMFSLKVEDETIHRINQYIDEYQAQQK